MPLNFNLRIMCCTYLLRALSSRSVQQAWDCNLVILFLFSPLRLSSYFGKILARVILFWGLFSFWDVRFFHIFHTMFEFALSKKKILKILLKWTRLYFVKPGLTELLNIAGFFHTLRKPQCKTWDCDLPKFFLGRPLGKQPACYRQAGLLIYCDLAVVRLVNSHAPEFPVTVVYLAQLLNRDKTSPHQHTADYRWEFHWVTLKKSFHAFCMHLRCHDLTGEEQCVAGSFPKFFFFKKFDHS